MYPLAQVCPIGRTPDGGVKALPGLHLRPQYPRMNWAVCYVPMEDDTKPFCYGLLDMRSGIMILLAEYVNELLPKLLNYYHAKGIVEVHRFIDSQPDLFTLN